MIKRSLCVFLFLTYLDIVRPYVFPSIKKCHFKDSACLKESFQKALPLFADGIPELGVEKMDELVIQDKTYKLGGLDFTLKDGRLKGLKSTVFDLVRMDMDNNYVYTKYHVPKCSIKGKYEGMGNIKVLPLRGSGEVFLKFRNVAVSLNTTIAMEKKNNKKYIVPKSYTFDYEVKDYAHFNLTNLFTGNEELSNTVLTFLNDNWRDVSKEFGRPMMEQQAKQLLDNISIYLKNSAVEDIFAL
ncbi:unnamed protein product [Leptosia nina]|uniref:Uncharacterized protein n=1 Tax=Leptosia nina TaxID=320188 RepID=A0AAV1K194_9NEOP